MNMCEDIDPQVVTAAVRAMTVRLSSRHLSLTAQQAVLQTSFLSQEFIEHISELVFSNHPDISQAVSV